MAIVRDPRTGQMIEVPDAPQSGLGVPRQPINVGRAIGDIGLGSLSIPGAALADLVGYRATKAVGGQVPAEPNPRLTAALQRVGTGVEQFGQANVDLFQGAQAAGRGLLGVQPAVTAQPTTARGTAGQDQAAVQPQPAAPQQPQVTDSQQAQQPIGSTSEATRPRAIRGQDGSLGQAATQRQAQATAAAGVGTGIGVGMQGGEIFRREGPGGVPEFFNEVAEGVPPSGSAPAGGTVSAPTGWRSNTGQSAADYLGTMRAQDQADVARRQQSGAEARVALERSALQRAATQGTGTDRLAARQALRAFEAQQLQQTQEAGATERAGMEVAGQLDQTRQQAASQAEQARIQGQFGLQEAALSGQYNLDQAQIGVQSAVQSAQAGVDPLKAQRAELMATRLRQLNAKIQAGTATDEDFLNYTSTAAAARDNTAQNPITGAPLSAAEIELEQRRNLERLQQTR